MPPLLDLELPFQGLTPKQERFALAVFAGKNYTEAYQEAYDCQFMMLKTINRRAYALATKPLVAARIKQLRLQRDAVTTFNASNLRMHCLRVMYDISCDKTNPKRLQAAVALGRTDYVGLYSGEPDDPADKVSDHNVEQKLVTLIERINRRQLTSGQAITDIAPGTIEHEPSEP